MDETKEIDLGRILRALLQKLWLVVLCAVLVAGAVFLYTENFVTPQYEATISVYVNNTNSNQISGISSSDLATSQRLVATYMNILKSNTVLNKVALELGLDISPDALRNMILAESPDGTEVFTVCVTNADPQLAADIANAIATVAPTEISNIVEGSSTKIVDWATLPKTPSSPSVLKNTVLGGVIGVLLAVMVIAVHVLLDVRIKDEEDLARISDAPVLGSIPDFNAEHKNEYEYSSADSDLDGKAVGA